MKGLILAAGKASRLFPLTGRIPRCLIPINGKPLIIRTILLLKSAGITDIIVNTHHKADRVRESLGDGKKLGVSIGYLEEPDLIGIGAAIKRAQSALAGETFLAVDDNVLADIDLADVVSYHHEQNADATLVLRPMPGATQHGPMEADGDESLATLIGDQAEEGGYLFPTGLRVLGPRIYDCVAADRACSLSQALARMVRGGGRIEGYVMDGYWSEMTTWEKYGHILWELGRGFVPEPPGL